jgi:hypothetical protein
MVELEDANADPDHPGGCGARALGCNANQEVNLSSHRAPGAVAAPYFPDSNPYNPISYAQDDAIGR